MNRWKYVVVTMCLVSACGDEGSGVDGGILMDADLMADAVILADADANIDAEVMRDAALMMDGSPPACAVDGDCGAREACVRGVCIASCGADLTGLSGILESAGLTPRAHLCGSFAALASRATGDGPGVVVLTGRESEPNALELRTWALGAEPASTSPFVYDTGAQLGMSSFLNDYIALNPTGTRAAVGYTNLSGDGRIVYGDLDSALGVIPQSVLAGGNYEAQWLDRDRLVVSGTGWGDTGRNGIYVVDPRRTPPLQSLVILGGCNSGSVAITAGFVLMGWLLWIWVDLA